MEPARLRFAAVLAARALVRAVFAAERAPFAAERALRFVLRVVLRARVFVLRVFFVLRLFVLRARPFEDDELRDDDELRRFVDERRLRPPPLRNAAGTSARAVVRASLGISFSR